MKGRVFGTQTQTLWHDMNMLIILWPSRDGATWLLWSGLCVNGAHVCFCCRLTMSSSLEYGSSSGGHLSARNFSLSPAFTCDSASSKVPATTSIQLCRWRHCVGYYRVKNVRAVRCGREIKVLLPSGCAYASPTVFSCRRRKSDGGGSWSANIRLS